MGRFARITLIAYSIIANLNRTIAVMLRRARFLVAALAAALLLAGGVSYVLRHQADSSRLTLYGNVDIREIQPAFNDNGFVTNMWVQEGDHVQPGQLIATLDDRRYMAAWAAAEAQAASQKQLLAAMLAGSRPEQIVAARAQMPALAAVARNAAINNRRYAALAPTNAASRQQRDNAKADYDNAEQNYQAARQAYILAVKGPRQEDIAAAQASYDAAKAQAALALVALRDTKLYAPATAVVENRILEPGDMASPQTPVYAMALTDPLWVRAYVPESALGRVRLGMAASITTDSYPGRSYRGWVGYLSPTAEFTPKNVETPDLRAELVYQLRVYVCNAAGDDAAQLRLGMPASVGIDLASTGPQTPRGVNVCQPP